MTKLLSISDFATSGINSDIIPWDLPGSFLTDILNIRIYGNTLFPFGGYLKWTNVASDNAGFLMFVGASSGTYWLIAGDTMVVAWDGATLTEIQPAAGFGTLDGDAWTGCLLSRIPVLNNPDYYPMYWPEQNTGIELEILPWDAGNTWQEAGEKCQVMRSHKQYLFALGVTQLGQFVPDGVRWSSPADVNGIPSTWDELDTTNVAGFVTLGGEGGDIIDGYSMRDSFVVYRERSISVFDSAGAPWIWQIRHLTTTSGLVSRDSLVEVEGRHYFISDGDIMVNDGNNVESIMHNRLRKRFVSDVNYSFYKNSFAVKVDVRNEIWFCVPGPGAEYATLIYIYNWRDDSWSIRNCPPMTHAAYGHEEVPTESWDSSTDIWSSASFVWNSGGLSPLENTLVGLRWEDAFNGRPAYLMFLDKTEFTESTDFSCHIERLGFPLEGLNNVTTITRVYPHMTGPGTCFIQLGSQDFPGAPTRWKPAIEFDPESDRKIDIRTTGELHCFRIFANEVEATWAISGLDIEYVNAGLR